MRLFNILQRWKPLRLIQYIDASDLFETNEQANAFKATIKLNSILNKSIFIGCHRCLCTVFFLQNEL